MATPAKDIPQVDEPAVEETRDVMTPEAAISNVRLIGITGLAETGKDTLANYIVNQYGAIKRSVAYPIKGILNQIFGFPASAWDDRDWKERPLPMIGHSPRVLAQSLGTEWGRAINEDLWIGKVIAHWRQNDCRLMVVPDIRFDNEAVYLLRSGGMMIRVTRQDAKPVAPHQSEQGVNDQLVHIEIPNDGTIKELFEAFDRAILKHVLDAQAAAQAAQNANGQ